MAKTRAAKLFRGLPSEPIHYIVVREHPCAAVCEQAGGFALLLETAVAVIDRSAAASVNEGAFFCTAPRAASALMCFRWHCAVLSFSFRSHGTAAPWAAKS